MESNKTDQQTAIPVIETLNQSKPSRKLNNSGKFLIAVGGIILLSVVCIGAYGLTKKMPQNSSKIVTLPSIAKTSPIPSPMQAKDFMFRGVPMFPSYRDGQVWRYEKYTSQQLKRSTVVVFTDPSDGRIMAKRIIGLSGDMLMVKDGNVYLNGQILNENNYINPGEKTTEGSFLHEGVTITVPQENYFIMGDNRPYSSDSREWGFVPNDKIIGILTTQIKPIDVKEDQCPCWDARNHICLPQTACQ